jgi:hypothetical protein
MKNSPPLTPKSLKAIIAPMLATANNIHIFGRTAAMGDPKADCEGWNERLKLSLNALGGISANDIDEINASERAAFTAMGAGNTKPMLSLNAMRIQQVLNFIVARPSYATLFGEFINLKDDETVAYQFQSRDEVTVRYIGPKGDVRERQLSSDELVSGGSIVPYKVLSTEKVTYPIYDYQKGRIADSATKMFDLRRDLDIKIGNLAYALGGSGYGPFTLTGAKFARTYMAHSNVNAALLPTTNSIDVTADSGGKFGIEVLLATLKYCDSWGDGTFEDGNLRPTGEILVPSNVTTDMIASLPMNSQITDLANKIQSEGYIQFTYAGITWKLIPDASSQATAGYCYPRLNKPAFTLMFKPGMESIRTEIVESENRGSSQIVTPIWAYQPEPYKVRQLRVKFA